MNKGYENYYENHKVIHIEQYKKKSYLFGIISFFGYVTTLIVYIICHLDITMKEQLLTLLAWLAIDFIFSVLYKMTHRQDRSFPAGQAEKQAGKAWNADRRTTKRKLQFDKGIGA